MVSDPNIAVVLIALGTLAMFAEFCRPGTVIPGVVGAVAFVTGLASLVNTTTPIAWPFALTVLTPVAGFSLFLGSIALRAHRNKRTTT